MPAPSRANYLRLLKEVDRTGLGLVIARKMMSQMGGSIEIESVKGEGTRVELRVQEADGDC